MSRWPRAGPASERGFASVTLLALVVLAGLGCLALADVANVLVGRVRAQAAADAAALAAAVEQWPFLEEEEGEMGPEEAAGAAAEANGARLEGCDCPLRGERARVRVSVETRIRMLGVAPPRVYASATAAVDPGALFRRARGEKRARSPGHSASSSSWSRTNGAVPSRSRPLTPSARTAYRFVCHRGITGTSAASQC